MHQATKRRSPIPLAGETGLGEHLEETVRRIDTTTNAGRQHRVSVSDHSRLHSALVQAERAACYALAAIRGRTAEEVAAEVASRAITALRSKTSTPEPR